MANNEVCIKCQSKNIIPGVRVVDEIDTEGVGSGELSVLVDENPSAWFFQGEHRGVLSARICGECGYTELYVSNPKELLAAYRTSQEDSSEG